MAAGNDNDPQASTIPVLSTDPEKKEEKKANGDAKGKGKEESDVPDIVRQPSSSYASLRNSGSS